MRTAVVLFTRDLRVHDHPALAAACAVAEHVVPLFVLDPALLGRSANRDRFLHQALADLRAGLRERGADLVVRRGDTVAETIAVARAAGADGIAVSHDVSRFATRRQERLRAEADRHRMSLRLFPGVTVLPPGEVSPGGGGGHYRVFSPYFRAWESAALRDEAAPPQRIAPLPDAGALGVALPEPPKGESPDAAEGGETEGRRRLTAWLRHIDAYDDQHDAMADDDTSRLSAYLRFGCLSPLAVVNAARRQGGPGAAAFVRQLCWRDFYYQVTAGFPDISRKPMRPSGDRDWRYDAHALEAWQSGRTGVPIVDAGMRQLMAEGWMHNRARLITAALLTKHLRCDWRDGQAWFFRWLIDGDVANNSGNWQWVAGTGNDTRPHRRFNPIRQAQRYDPEGDYVRRYVPELAGIPGPAVHQPWRLDGFERLDYPPPLESHGDEAVWLRP
ncbi:cryptochrome/photolyase family protein [Catenuloplanes atrovinosus]|uniref:Deoxyribodipyrimidine photo-lyase n=1 Tax=Catenuloplanes atrovinosus TaxID=137266 RepID=A0AAE4CD35_9ACTN|nr:deoxyribodipyrimidine photo-lyase [Catenuloplanes atrovinosus]MDR7280226.1 deoxyribodipyrimidine photo-lyase [Catenuloplanes atrovinosus]